MNDQWTRFPNLDEFTCYNQLFRQLYHIIFWVLTSVLTRESKKYFLFYSRLYIRFHHCWRLDTLSNIQFTFFNFVIFWDCPKGWCYDWYNCHTHVQQFVFCFLAKSRYLPSFQLFIYIYFCYAYLSISPFKYFLIWKFIKKIFGFTVALIKGISSFPSYLMPKSVLQEGD